MQATLILAAGFEGLVVLQFSCCVGFALLRLFSSSQKGNSLEDGSAKDDMI